MGNKQEEMEAIVWQANCDIVTNAEIWWDHSHDWTAAMDAYKLIRRDRQLRRGSGMALYIREYLNVVEIRVGNYKVESFLIRIGG